MRTDPQRAPSEPGIEYDFFKTTDLENCNFGAPGIIAGA